MKKYFLIAIIITAAVLRFYKLGEVPPSLYWDEASLGYNAYSILKTAKDEYGNHLPTTNFPAFGDYKPPLYIYAAVPPIAIFGLGEFAIRFPSAFFGILTVFLAYKIAKELFEDENIALLASLFLSISPWHLQLSRGAFEANLGLFFSSLGIYFFVKFAKSNPFFIFASAISFLAATYTFTGQRLFVPFILIVLFIQFREAVVKNLKFVALAGAIALFLFWPLFKFATFTQEGRLRFNEVTIFKDLEPIERSTRYRDQDNYSFISSIINNRRIYYGQEYLKHYFDAFNPTFLFTKGDGNPRFSTQEVGGLYYLDLPLLLLGLYYLFAKNHKYKFLILGWLLVSPLGPATARETPHALRMVHILPTFQLIAAFGLVSFYNAIKFKKLLVVVTAAGLALNLFYFLHMYYIHWPLNYSINWQYGYKQAIEAVKGQIDQSDHIVVTKEYGRPYIYFLLFLNYDPAKFHQTAQVERDKFYFLDVNGFDKFIFAKNLDEVDVNGKITYVVSPNNTPKDAKVIKTIEDLNGKPIFEISQLDK